MKLEANKDKTYKAIELADEYMRVAIFYVIFAVCSIGLFLAFTKSFLMIVLCVGSILGSLYMFINYKALGKKQFKLDECFISVDEKFLECRQLVNGQYEYMKVGIHEIVKIMEVKDGFQFWIRENSSATNFVTDDERISRTTACVNHYAYEKDDFIKIYAFLTAFLPEDTEALRDGQNWQDENQKSETIKMLIPCIIFVIAAFLSFFI